MTAARTPLGLAAAALLGAAVVGLAQPGLARDARTVRFTEDAVVVPPPSQLEVLSLGYRAAVVDVLWAKLLLEYGVHVAEKRPFPEITSFLDGLEGLEPTYPNLYRFADTLLLYGPPPQAGAKELRLARGYLERATIARPTDADVWLHYGQVLAYLSPTFLDDEAEIRRWRADGARAVGRAVELGADPDRALSAGAVLVDGGERAEAARRFQAAYVVAQDPTTRRKLFARLLAVDFAAAWDVARATQRFDDARRAAFPFLTVHGALLVGPARDASACAGAPASDRCPRDWADVVDRLAPDLDRPEPDHLELLLAVEARPDAHGVEPLAPVRRERELHAEVAPVDRDGDGRLEALREGHLEGCRHGVAPALVRLVRGEARREGHDGEPDADGLGRRAERALDEDLRARLGRLRERRVGAVVVDQLVDEAGRGDLVRPGRRQGHADAEVRVPRLEDVAAVAVVGRHLVEEHALGALDVGGVDRGRLHEASRLGVRHAEGVLEHHVGAARAGVARLRHRPVRAPVAEEAVLGHVVGVGLGRGLGGAVLDRDRAEPLRGAIPVHELHHVRAGLREAEALARRYERARPGRGAGARGTRRRGGLGGGRLPGRFGRRRGDGRGRPFARLRAAPRARGREGEREHGPRRQGAGDLVGVEAMHARTLAGRLIVAGYGPAELPEAYRRRLAAGALGGIVLFKRNLGGSLHDVHARVRALGAIAPQGDPPLVAVDQEGGRVARLGAPLLRVPPLRRLGELADARGIAPGGAGLAFVRDVAEAQARELAALGFTTAFSPVLDVDSNPENPVIGDRSFGRDPHRVAALGRALAEGLARGGLLACGKHFPGHGDTSVDSHLALPRVDRPRASLDATELVPFRDAARDDAFPLLMTAHVVYPALDAERPATLSPRVATDLLRGELGYRGVLVSDDLEMKAIAGDAGEAAVAAIAAGCDALLVCSDEGVLERVEEALARAIDAGGAFAARARDADARFSAVKRRVPPRPADATALAEILDRSAPVARALAEAP